MQQSYLIIASKNAVYVQINVHPKPHEICTFCPFFYISLYPTSLLPKVLTRWVGLPPHTGSAASALRQLSALPHRLDHNQPAGPGQSMSPQHMRALNKLPLGLLGIEGEGGGSGILTTIIYQDINFANSVP